jgi:hypothetical protein
VLKAHIGITATTGQLADNHDVLSLLSYSDSTVMETEDIKQLEKVSFETATSMGVTDRLLRYDSGFCPLCSSEMYNTELVLPDWNRQ